MIAGKPANRQAGVFQTTENSEMKPVVRVDIMLTEEERAAADAAPDDNGNLPTLHYGHVGAVIEIAKKLDDLAEALRQVVTER